MIEVICHWLGLGLDGFRLDAVPYLFEADGTNGENLPETHEYLRRVRREIDAHDYAIVNFTVSENGVRECAPRMVRADRCKHENGEAWIYIGAMGNAIAQRENLPFGVSFI